MALLEEGRPAPAGRPITHRESDVLRLVAEGMSNKEVGADLGISPRTVEKHLENARATLGVSNRTAAALPRPPRSSSPDRGLAEGWRSGLACVGCGLMRRRVA